MRSNCGRDFTTLAGWPRQILESSLQSRLSRWTGRKGTPHQHFLLSLTLVFLCVFLPSAAQAAILVVNVLTDEVEDSCPTTCSIRAALASANAGDEIQFDVTGTIVLTQGELVVDKDLTITGPGAENLALDGNSASRVLAVQTDATAIVKGITIQNGYTGNESEDADTGSGIYNRGTLTLSDSTLSGNTSLTGGGIYNEGTLTLTDSTLSGNSAYRCCIDITGFSEGPGGGIYNQGTLTVTNSTFSANRAGDGGGISSSGGTVMVINSTLSGNSAWHGGGIFTAGPLTLTNSTLSGNSAESQGGGIASQDTLTVINSTLSGNSAEVIGGGISIATGTVTLTNSTLTGNRSPNGGGGIINWGTLSLTNCNITDNSATGIFVDFYLGGYGGGGIYNGMGGSLTLTDSTLSGNSGIETGGGILNLGSARLTNSTISGNAAIKGGGIFNGGSLTLSVSTLTGNSANNDMGTSYIGFWGGGIFNNLDATLTVTNSTFSDNSADDNGGGILNMGRATVTNSTLSWNSAHIGGGIMNGSGMLTLTSSTLSGNSAVWEGGGIANSGTLTLTDSTFSGNSSPGSGGGILSYNNEYAVTTLARSIFAQGTSGENCAGGGLISQGDNISSDSTCITNNPTLNDRNNTDPLLDPAGLQDNGGPTLTIALQPGSPAIDGVRYGTCPPPDTDQRGVPRPSGARCDIGAVEMSGNSAPITVALDIKPGSAKNHINPRSNEKIAVAILSTNPDDDTAEPFDATTVDPRSVRFGPKGAKAKTSKVKDVNHDGAADLLLTFKNRSTGIQCGDTSAELTGETLDGQAIKGTDTIKTVGLRCIDPEALARLRRLLHYLLSLEGDHGHGDHGHGSQGHGSYH